MLGASLLAAAASAPLHIAPLLMVAVVAEGRLPLAQAGWIISAYMVGQLVVALGLPASGFWRLTRAQSLAAAAVMLVAVVLSGFHASMSLVACWLALGAACGGLQFVGATAAAASQDRQRAFALRLAVTLVASGILILGVQMLRGFQNYAHLSQQLAGVLCALLVAGLVLYRAPDREALEAGQPARQQGTHRFLGLLVVFLLFAGQTGFMAYAVQGAQERGAALEHLAYAFGLCKVAGGLALFILMTLPQPGKAPSLLRPGLVLVGGVGVMAASHDAWAFTLGLLLWELGLNVLSARLSASVVRDNPAFAGPWLAGTVFVGAAAGPALHGLAIGVGLHGVFIAYAAICALIPAVWIARAFSGRTP